MTSPAIDPARFADLQDTAGADFVVELSTLSSRRRRACWRNCARHARLRCGSLPPRRAFTEVERPHLRRTHARRARARPGTDRNEADPAPGRGAPGRARGRIRARCSGTEGVAPWLSVARACWSSTTTRSTGCCSRAPSNCRGTASRSAENGRVALEMLRREPFDLLLLDIEMPEMNGLQVLEQLKADLQLRDLPVIVTSVIEGLDSVVRCIELGAEDYLHKPVNPVLLKARIGASLEKKRLRDQQKELLRRFATPEVAQDLDASGFALGGHCVQATAMFSDIRGFTSISEQLPPEETIDLLNTYYTLMFDAISGHGGVVNQMVGDGLMAIFGAPLPLADPCGAAVRAALDMIEMIELFNRDPERAGKPAIAIGIGIASGERDRRLHRHPAARDLHLRRRRGEPGRAARGTYEGRRTCRADRRRHPTRARRAMPVRGARRGALQGQGGASRGVLGAQAGAECSGNSPPTSTSVTTRSRRRWHAVHEGSFRRMSATNPRVPSPSNVVLHTASRVLEIAFDDGANFRLPFEFLRVYSPSAEVRGHGPGQETLQVGKRDVTIDDVAAGRALRGQAVVLRRSRQRHLRVGLPVRTRHSTRNGCGPSTSRASKPPARAASGGRRRAARGRGTGCGHH